MGKLYIRMPNKTWAPFGLGGGHPLKLRMPGNNWQTISTAGLGNAIYGTIRHLDGRPAVGHNVIAFSATASNVATTDESGFYAVTGLPYGTYEVWAYTKDFYTHAVGSATISNAHKGAEVNLTLPTELASITLGFTARTGWSASTHVDYDDSSDSGQAGSPVTFLSSYSETETNFGTQGTQRFDGVSWMAVPIPRLREIANNQAQATLDDPVLEAVTVLFDCTTASYMNDLGGGVTDFPGSGYIGYLGDLAFNTTPPENFDWDMPMKEIRIDDNRELVNQVFPRSGEGLQCVRNLPFNRSFNNGQVVWEGELNASGRFSTRHGVPVDIASGLLYYVATEEAPMPPSHHHIILELFADISVEFIYRFG